MTRAAVLLLAFSGAALAQEKVRVAELSPQAEAAIAKGLRHLVETQNKDGSWDDQNPVANTALALMAFLVGGHFPEQPPYGDAMARGVDYLLRAAGPKTGTGYLGKNMYEHGLATLALCEVWGESSRSDEIRDALKRAVAVIVNGQSAAGGWRYQPNVEDQDVSITVVQIVALASAREAGILVPDATLERAVRYVESCQAGTGQFGYRDRTDPGVSNRVGDRGFARTAAGTLALLLGGERQSAEVRAGLAHLRRLGDAPFRPDFPWFYYGHYYAVQAMYQSGEKDYQAWYPRVRDALVGCQRPDGSWAGGIPRGVGTIVKTNPDSYCTPMAILILGVPYRFLPIYQR